MDNIVKLLQKVIKHI